MGETWVRVTHGAHRARSAADVWAASLAAWGGVLPPTAAFTHLTGAALLGMWIPRLPAEVESGALIWAQIPREHHPVRRPGAHVIRVVSTHPPRIVQRGRQALRVAAPADVLLALATHLDGTDLLIATDSALHLRLATADDLAQAAASGRRGSPALRRALALADGRSESAWETVLREFHRIANVPVEPQYEVRTRRGDFVARGDLRVAGLDVLHEYDGHHHLERERQRADLRRARRLESVGWIRRGYTSDDLLRRPHEMLADLDRTLDRAPDQRRLAAWCVLVNASAVSARGLRALHTRLGT